MVNLTVDAESEIKQIEYKKKGYSEAEVEILLQIARMDERLKTVTDNYVQRKEFEPVQKIVYGLVGVVLVSFLTAVLALIIMQV